MSYMALAFILIAIEGISITLLGIDQIRDRKARLKAEDKLNDVYAGWMSGTTVKLNELERRLNCVEEDLEKIPVEEVEAEYRRLENFNDGIMNIMNFGPDVPKLNKEGLRNE